MRTPGRKPKLTADQVNWVQSQTTAGVARKALALDLGVSHQTVSRVIRGGYSRRAK